MNIGDLKTKIEELKKREQELSIREGVVNALLPLKEKMYSKVKDANVNNGVSIIKEIANSIETKIEDSFDLQPVINQLDGIQKSLESESNKTVVNSIKEILTEIQEMSKKTYVDQQRFDNIFSEKIDTIVNILLNGEEVPSSVSYRRNDTGKITKVIETYNSFTLEHVWTYDRNQNLVNVQTIKNDKTP